jgi:uncharacterized protein (DUF1778 family)
MTKEPTFREQKREKIIKVRTTTDQFRVIERAARADGLDVSTYVRAVALRASGYGATLKKD